MHRVDPAAWLFPTRVATLAPSGSLSHRHGGERAGGGGRAILPRQRRLGGSPSPPADLPSGKLLVCLFFPLFPPADLTGSMRARPASSLVLSCFWLLQRRYVLNTTCCDEVVCSILWSHDGSHIFAFGQPFVAGTSAMVPLLVGDYLRVSDLLAAGQEMYFSDLLACELNDVKVLLIAELFRILSIWVPVHSICQQNLLKLEQLTHFLHNKFAARACVILSYIH